MIPLDYFIALVVAVAVGGIVGHVATARSYTAYVAFLIARITELTQREVSDDEADWWKGKQ